MNNFDESEMKRQEEYYNKKLISNMWVLSISTLIFYVTIIVLAAITLEEGLIQGTIIVVSTFVLVSVSFYAVKIEADAGYYECSKCKARYIVPYSTLIRAPHLSTTRYMRCPECSEKSWAKKVWTK